MGKGREEAEEEDRAKGLFAKDPSRVLPKSSAHYIQGVFFIVVTSFLCFLHPDPKAAQWDQMSEGH